MFAITYVEVTHQDRVINLVIDLILHMYSQLFRDILALIILWLLEVIIGHYNVCCLFACDC